jgi:hypothetical protein
MQTFADHLNRARVAQGLPIVEGGMTDAEWVAFGRICERLATADIGPWVLGVEFKEGGYPVGSLFLEGESPDCAIADFWATEGGSIRTQSYTGDCFEETFGSVDDACDCLARLLLPRIEEEREKAKATKLCPDCDGTGRASPPAVPVPA